MSASPWPQAQRSQQQQHKHHQRYPSIFRSVTPPPPSRPRSAAAANSPPRGRHVIPRSLSVLHARPPSAPQSGASSNPGLGVCDSPQPQATSATQKPGTVGNSHHLQVDYSAIQRIADGVERMVRSWTSENSCRAQVYAKAYDSLHAAAARGKDQETDSGLATKHQHHPPQEPMNACTDTASFKFNTHSDIHALQNLQSPAHPHSMEMSQSILGHSGDNNLVNINQMESTHVGQTSHHAGHADYDNAKWSSAAPCTPAIIPGNHHHLMENGEVLYTEEPSYDHDAKKLKTSNMCVHNRTHNHPIGLCLIKEDDDIEKRSSGNIPHLVHYNSNRHDGLRMDYDTQELAKIQHSRSQQEDLEPGTPLLIQQHYQRINHLQGPPVIIRDGMINSNSLIKSAIRSRSPSLRLGTLSNNACNSLNIYRESIKNDRKLDEKYEAKVKELEISLLECATEYEVQLVEMKMKMLQMKSEFRQKGTPEDNKPAAGRPLLALTQDAANVAQNNSKVSRQANTSPEVSPDQSLEPAKLKHRPLKDKYSENVPPPRPKTRPEGIQQKKSNLDDSGKIVTCLQKLLSKKEQELLNSKIREKELAGQIHELQTIVQRGRVTQMEPKKLLSLLLALNEWLQSVKVGVVNDDPNLHRKAYQNVHALAHLRMNLEEPQLSNRNNNQSPRIENLAAIVNKEIKTLQEILGKLTPHRKRPK